MKNEILQKTPRLIHTSHSYEKKLKNNNNSIQNKDKRRESVYRDIFFLVDEEKSNSSEDDENSELNITIYYDGRRIYTKFNRHKTFAEFTKYIQKKYFKIGFEENYKIFYNQVEIPMNDKRKIKKIVEGDKSEVVFMLKAKDKNFINTNIKKIYVELENIPSFMDLSDQINNFINSQNDFGINFDIIYKDNCCRILFSTSETAFSFISYMTNIKFSNKFYRKLKIDIKYNALENSTNLYDNNRNLLSISEENIINKHKLKLGKNKIMKTSNSNTNMRGRYNKFKNKKFNTESNYDYIYGDYYEDNYESIQDSSPYGYENELAKMQEIMNKKKWMVNKNFFTSINKHSFNRLITPNKYFLKKYKNNYNNNYNVNNKNNNKKDINNVITPFNNKIYKLKISDI